MPTMLKRPAAAAATPVAKKHKQAGQPVGAGTKSAKEAKDAASTKRVKEAKAPPQPKRDPLLVKVAAGLAFAVDMPDAAKAMLDDALEDSLGALKEERHPYQTAIVDIIGDTLGAIEKSLQVSLDGVQESIARIDATKSSAATAAAESQTKLEDQKSEVRKRKHDLSDIAMAFKAAREAVSEVKFGQEEAERGLRKAAGDKQQLEMALADKHCLDMALSQENINNLVSILKRFGFDESMMSALPSALLKEPTARGPFDTMVLSQLEAEVAKRIAGIDAVLVEAEPDKAERAANLERAEANLVEAKAKQLDSARMFQEARAEEEHRVEAVQEAKKAVSEASLQARRLQKEADKGQRALDGFREGPQATFWQLRDRSAPAPAVAGEEAEALPTKVAEAEGATVVGGGDEGLGAARQEEISATAEC